MSTFTTRLRIEADNLSKLFGMDERGIELTEAVTLRQAADVIDEMEAALNEIAEAEYVNLALDPQWPQRIAEAALSKLETL